MQTALNDFIFEFDEKSNVTQVLLGEINVTDLIIRYAFDSNIFYRYYYQYNYHFSFPDNGYSILNGILKASIDAKNCDAIEIKTLSATIPTYLFGHLGIYSEYLINKRKYLDAIIFWRGVINAVNTWEKLNKAEIHKGTAYGQLARIYMIIGDIESAFLLLYNAINEDELLTEFPQFKDYPQRAPSYLTLSLNPSQDNFLFNYLNDIRYYLEQRILSYNTEFGKTFNITEFDILFLNNPKLDKIKEFRNMKFLFVYYLWSVIDQSKKYDVVNVKGEFSNVHKLNKIAGACVLVDELLKFVLGKTDGYVGKSILELNKKEQWVTDGFLNKYMVKSYYDSKTTSDKVTYILYLLDKTNNSFEGDSLDAYKRMFTVLYLIRNLVSHSLYSENKFNEQFYDIMSIFLNSIFCIIRSKTWNDKLSKLI